MTRIRFLADADLKARIVRGLARREPLIDFAGNAAPDGLDDLRVLALAAAQGRVLVSNDVGTMPAAFQSFLATANSPGLLLVPQRLAASQAIERIHRLWHDVPAEHLRNQVWFLP